MKVLRYILLGLTACCVIFLLCYQGFVTRELTAATAVRALLILAGVCVALLRPNRKKTVANKKATYQKAYSQYIRNTFYDDPKLEKKFYKAVDDYNFSHPAAALKKLERLRRECQRTDDLYAVTVFTALCCDDLHAYAEAIGHYHAANQIRPQASLLSNIGLCHMRLGDNAAAFDAYHKAIAMDGSNAFALNNLATLYFRQGDYESALDHAEAAIDADFSMPQALSCAAICCKLLGYEEEYITYYRRAVSAGYDGGKIKRAISQLDPTR